MQDIQTQYQEHDKLLRQTMKSWGIQPREVANRTGKSVGYIAYVLRGERRSLAIKQAIVEMIGERKAAYDKLQAELEQLVDGPMGG